ncbi:MAG TPA: uroporphyrinogen-III C-methyltransferase [Usitatibacter sp.]
MGKVYLVGAGPGAPDLLTLRAARLLEAADVVLHDALVHPRTLALATRARRVDVGKRNGRVCTEQRFIHRVLVHAASRHDVVVRLKGGDPLLFGRAQEEIDALAAEGIAVEIVPGVTSALAAAASLGVSLTRRGTARSVAFLTPRTGAGEPAGDWTRAALAADTAALYMAAGASATVAAALLAAGKPADTPVAFVEDASLDSESRRYATLGELASRAPRPARGPVMMLMGEALRARAALPRRDDEAPLTERIA